HQRQANALCTQMASAAGMDNIAIILTQAVVALGLRKRRNPRAAAIQTAGRRRPTGTPVLQSAPEGQMLFLLQIRKMRISRSELCCDLIGSHEVLALGNTRANLTPAKIALDTELIAISKSVGARVLRKSLNELTPVAANFVACAHEMFNVPV